MAIGRAPAARHRCLRRDRGFGANRTASDLAARHCASEVRARRWARSDRRRRGEGDRPGQGALLGRQRRQRRHGLGVVPFPCRRRCALEEAQLSPSGKDPGVPAEFFDLSPSGDRADQYGSDRTFPVPPDQRPVRSECGRRSTARTTSTASAATSEASSRRCQPAGPSHDELLRQPDTLFKLVDGVGTRRMIARDAPT